jgi:hypothetical protein
MNRFEPGRIFASCLRSAVLHGLTAIISLFLLSGCDRTPRDAKLREAFFANKDDFNKLVSMSQQDPTVTRIRFELTIMKKGSEFIKNEGLSGDRWQEYRVLFKKLGLAEGLGRTQAYPSAILFYVYCEGSAIDADCKGFAYSETQLAPLATSLNTMRPGYVFEQFYPNWYLFRWVS